MRQKITRTEKHERNAAAVTTQRERHLACRCRPNLGSRRGAAESVGYGEEQARLSVRAREKASCRRRERRRQKLAGARRSAVRSGARRFPATARAGVHISSEMLIVIFWQCGAAFRELFDMFGETHPGYPKVGDFETLEQLGPGSGNESR